MPGLRVGTAFITGAAQGLGKAFSEVLISRGVRVCLCDVQSKKGKEVERDFQRKYGQDKAIFLQCDVRSDGDFSNVFKEAVSTFGHIDMVVNNAGIADESRSKDMIDINLSAVVKGTELAVKHMRKDQGGNGGTIINIASTAGLTPVFFSPVYVATKYGVVGFTSCWASNPHLAELGIQFACLCPAFTKTAIINLDENKVHYPEEAFAFMRKVGINEVEDVAKAFTMLLDTENCNGDILTITPSQGIQYNRKNGKPVTNRL